MGHMSLKEAQALLDRVEGKVNEPQVVEQVQTVPVVESAVPQPVATPVVEEAPVVVEPEPQPVVVNPQPDFGAELAELKARLDKSENAYKSLQGKYNKELPDARNDNARLQAEISLLKDQLYQKASVQETPKKVEVKDYLGQDKVEELGENYVDGIDAVTDFKIQEALKAERAKFESELEALKQVQTQDKWDRYNHSVSSQVTNFIELVDPYGNGRLNEEFEQFLQSRYMLQAFDDADRNMQSKAVVDICKMYNDSKIPQQPVQPQAPVVNPKAQAVAPPTTNNATPQSQPSTPVYLFSVRDYIDKAQQFARGKIKQSTWLNFEEKYNKAMAEGKVKL